MTKISNLVGTYQYTNKVLTNTLGLKLLISNRLNTSSTKTPLFLVDKSTPKGQYVSSLYPIDENSTYKFDYKGIGYVLTIKNDIATIEQSPLYINRTL